MHTGDSPYVCAYEKCKAAFKTSTGLKRHATVHSPKTPNPCPYCSFKANSKGKQKNSPNILAVADLPKLSVVATKKLYKK